MAPVGTIGFLKIPTVKKSEMLTRKVFATATKENGITAYKVKNYVGRDLQQVFETKTRQIGDNMKSVAVGVRNFAKKLSLDIVSLSDKSKKIVLKLVKKSSNGEQSIKLISIKDGKRRVLQSHKDTEISSEIEKFLFGNMQKIISSK